MSIYIKEIGDQSQAFDFLCSFCLNINLDYKGDMVCRINRATSADAVTSDYSCIRTTKLS